MMLVKKLLILTTLFLSQISSAADEKIKLNFINEDITKVVEAYAKQTGQKFIIDPGVRGKITILNAEDTDKAEAFNQLASGLAVNGYAYFQSGDTIVIQSARNAQRSGIEVFTELPPQRPEKMVSWIISLKYVSAEEINRELRMLTSKDGELSPFRHGNQIIISDWTSSLQRVAKLIEKLDKPAPVGVEKINKTYESKRQERMKAFGAEGRGKIAHPQPPTPPPAPPAE